MDPSTRTPAVSPHSSPHTPEEPFFDITFGHNALVKPSGDIRLLRFSTAESSSIYAPQLTLEAWPLSDTPPYVAVSYTWGSPNLGASIFVNGDRAVVTWNCLHVLQQLAKRQDPATVHFWIDSICIDQQNLDEKSLQVALMQDIYRHASEVLACIGPHADGSDLVIEVMARLDTEHPNVVPGSTHSDRISDRFGTPLDETIQKVFTTEEKSNPLQSAHERFAKAYLSLARRQYWSRMWIIQELWLAKTVRLLCGDSELLLSKAAKWALACRDIVAPNTQENYGFSESHQLAGMDVMIDWLFMREQKLTHLKPWTALQTFYPWMCGNFRDRAYALLGITTWAGSLPVPDYSLGKFRWLIQILNCLSYEKDEQTPLRDDIGWLVDSVDWKLQDYDAQALLAERREPSPVSFASYASEEVTHLRWRPSALSLGYIIPLFDLEDDVMGTSSPRHRTTYSLPGLKISQKYRRIQEDGITVGYVPTSTTCGDVLFAPGHSRMLYLVLRELPDMDRFRVVGYALYMSRTTSALDARLNLQPTRPPNFRFDPEDALVFALFDLRTWSLHGEDQGEIDQTLVEYILEQPATRSSMSSYGLRDDSK